MQIPESEWADAAGSYVIDASGNLWRIVGFVDRPTVILDPVKPQSSPGVVAMKDDRKRQYLVMGSSNSTGFRRLIPEGDA